MRLTALASGAAEAAKIIEEVRKSGRTILTEVESKRLLSAYGIPTVPTEVATTAEEAVELAEKFGYPVVLKLYSETITHKTDVGGVRLNLCDPQAVRNAFTKIQSAVTEKAGASTSRAWRSSPWSGWKVTS